MQPMDVNRMIQLLADKNIRVCDYHYDTLANTDNGWKISIQGKSVADSVFLYQRLRDILFTRNIPFKLATQKRINLANKEQAHKVMTIYIPNGIDRFELAEEIYCRIIDYKGWYNIKTPTSYEHYAGGLFIRNDRDEYGDYIPAN